MDMGGGEKVWTGKEVVLHPSGTTPSLIFILSDVLVSVLCNLSGPNVNKDREDPLRLRVPDEPAITSSPIISRKCLISAHL